MRKEEGKEKEGKMVQTGRCRRKGVTDSGEEMQRGEEVEGKEQEGRAG